MKILFVGDIVGRGGRTILRQKLSEIQKTHQVDFTIVNVENAAGGFGVTVELAEEVLACGADVMTSGNHIWDRREIFDYLNREPRLLRPGNYPPGAPGFFSYVAETSSGVRVGVMNLQGRIFMPVIDCPFQLAEKEVPKLKRETNLIIVDFHAEATSEKVAMGWFLDGKVSAVVGTHTHIPTADERILPSGTAYITDVGMTGSYEGVIGMKAELSLSRFVSGMAARLEVENQNPRLSAVLLDIDDSSGRARSIRRIQAQ